MGTSTDIPMDVVKPGSAPISMPKSRPPLIQINVSTRSARSTPASSDSIIGRERYVGCYSRGADICAIQARR